MTLKLENIIKDVGKRVIKKWIAEGRSHYGPDKPIPEREFLMGYIRHKYNLYTGRYSEGSLG
ncbi:hypothetical protein AUJ84_00190 [Candidatus Pacearchaeota archaeon CG1_02_32_132]|nr:MAG: hypothetical protein AUJ84_00190 [Candidatus Pacearchaeota archaeon CG1_02_32_132]